FGILLLELANEKLPYEECDGDFDKITVSILYNNDNKWNFNNAMPKEYINISKK
ncbi:10820_t:CDS:1, partial [Dentiscutata heterogama]